MDYRNGIPARWRTGTMQRGDGFGTFESNSVQGVLTDLEARDGVGILLHLLTRLANCGLDAGAPPLLRSARTEI